MESTCPGSMICKFDYPPNGFSRNQRLCPLEFFDLVLINDHKTSSNGRRDPPDCFKKGDIDILNDLDSYDRNKTLLFYVNPSDLIRVEDWKEAKEYKSNGKTGNSKFCQKRVQMPQIDQNDKEKIVLKYAEAVEWYFKKIKTQVSLSSPTLSQQLEVTNISMSPTSRCHLFSYCKISLASLKLTRSQKMWRSRNLHRFRHKWFNPREIEGRKCCH